MVNENITVTIVDGHDIPDVYSAGANQTKSYMKEAQIASENSAKNASMLVKSYFDEKLYETQLAIDETKKLAQEVNEDTIVVREEANKVSNISSTLTSVYNKAIAEGKVQAPIIDNTLSVDGAGADANKVGVVINAIKSSAYAEIQFLDKTHAITARFWENAGRLGGQNGWVAYPKVENLKAGTYYFCGINPVFTWVVNRSTNAVTPIANLFVWTDADYFMKHSVTIPYDFDLYACGNNINFNPQTVKNMFANYDWGADIETYFYGSRVDTTYNNSIIKTSLLVHQANYRWALPDLNKAEEGTLYYTQIPPSLIANMPEGLPDNVYFVLTIRFQWNNTRKKQFILNQNNMSVIYYRDYEEGADNNEGWYNWQLIDDNQAGYVITTKTVGVGGDYATIHQALDSITDNSENKRYKILVKAGIYDVPADRKFLGLKNYVDIVGVDKAKVFVRNIASTNSYDASKATFDPAYYNQSIKWASLQNMTIISQGCKCPIHIDGHAIANGGEVLIENCILQDLNTVFNYNTNWKFTRIGGINCGLGNGQKVTVKNTISNGTIYAHNHGGSTIPSTFVIDHCTCRGTLIGSAYIQSCMDDYYITDSTLDYVVLQRDNNCPNVYNIRMGGNNRINYIFAPDGDVVNDPYRFFDEDYNGKFAIPDTSCMELMFNTTDRTINRGDIVGFVNDPNNKGYLAEKFIGVGGHGFAGKAMENIPSRTLGWVQYAGKISIPVISGANVGDLIDYVNGQFTLHTNDNRAIGVYGTSSHLYTGEVMLKLF